MWWYILNDSNVPIPVDPMTGAKFLQQTKRRTVAHTRIDTDEFVSTVFLCLDHSFTPDSPPVLFETLVFGGEHDGTMKRYYTWELAEQGHWQLVKDLWPELYPHIWEGHF